MHSCRMYGESVVLARGNRFFAVSGLSAYGSLLWSLLVAHACMRAEVDLPGRGGGQMWGVVLTCFFSIPWAPALSNEKKHVKKHVKKRPLSATSAWHSRSGRFLIYFSTCFFSLLRAGAHSTGKKHVRIPLPGSTTSPWEVDLPRQRVRVPTPREK
jgi:hypothetical protein